jgi:hypothetical protein
MFQKLLREEPEVLALLAIVLMALFVRPPSVPRVQWDLDAWSMERELPRVQFIPFRQ